MTDGLKASQIKGGIRPSKSFEQGRVCNDESCETKLSIYNKRVIVLTMLQLNIQELEEEFFRKLPKKPKLPN